MQLKKTLLQLALASLFTHAVADCQLKNEVGSEDGKIETNDKLCVPQGEGDWTFAMEVSLTGVPVPDGDNAFAGMVGNYGFAIYDNTCALRGKYDPSNNGNDCGTPFTIMENFLQYVLTVKSLMANVGGSFFSFKYGDGLFSINNNHCDCVSEPQGLRGLDFCKCAFPIDGKTKRALEFKA